MKQSFDRECAVSLEATTAENTTATEAKYRFNLHQLKKKPVNVLTKEEDLMPEYMFAPDAARYLNITPRKIAMFRKYGLLKWSKLGRNYCYKKQWLDEFMDTWNGYDLSSESAVRLAINGRKWREKHGM